METSTYAREYYTQFGAKNIEGMKSFLHPDVEFQSPLASLKGKDAVVAAASNFMNAFQSLTIRTQFGTEDQAVVIYEVNIPGISPNVPTCALLTFRDNLIVKIELFFDGSQFLSRR